MNSYKINFDDYQPFDMEKRQRLPVAIVDGIDM